MSNVTTMQISIDTKEDSHEEIKKVIKMLQNLVGDSQEIFTNEPSVSQETASPIANIFGEASSSVAASEANEAAETTQETEEQAQTGETSQSTDDLFAELFSEEELKKMDASPEKEEEEEPESKPKGKKPSIELY